MFLTPSCNGAADTWPRRGSHHTNCGVLIVVVVVVSAKYTRAKSSGWKMNWCSSAPPALPATNDEHYT